MEPLLLLYFMLIAVSFVLTYAKFKRFILPNTIFTTIWSVVAVLSVINNLTLLKPGGQIHKYIIISIICFNITYLLASKKKIGISQSEKLMEYRLNYKLIFFLNTIALLTMLPYMFLAIQIIFQSGFANVRNVLYVSISEGSSIIAILTRTIPSAIFTAVSLIAATDLVQNKYKLLPIALIDILVYTITFGGRFSILNFIIYYAASYIILKKLKRIRIKKRYIALGTIGLILITVLRDRNGMSVLDMGILYFAGSLSYLEVIINRPDIYGLGTKPMLGYMTLGFIFEPIVLALKFFLKLDIDVPSYYFNIYAQQWTNIGTIEGAIWYNNNTTMFYTFLFDFGQIGIVIGTTFLALLSSKAQNQYFKTGNPRSLFLLVYLYGVIINSTMVYSLTSLHASIVLIFLFISVKKTNVKFIR